MGEGFLIANVATVDDNICETGSGGLGLASRAKTQDPKPRTPSPFRTAILYFALSHISGVKARAHIDPPGDDETYVTAAGRALDRVDRWRREGTEIRDYLGNTDQTALQWQGIREESIARQAARTTPRWNICLHSSGVFCTHLSLFDQHTTRIDKGAAALLHDINGKRPVQLVMQRAQRDALMEAIGEKSPWSVDPRLATAVAQAVEDYGRERAPLYPLPEIQRLGYSWAHDKLSQCVDRCHRLNSEKDLNFYAILCDGSMDQKMEQNLAEKGDTSDLVLDGHLLGENPEEMNLGELLRIAISEFNTETKTVDERVIEAEWPDLKRRLRAAAEAWHAPGGIENVERVEFPPAPAFNPPSTPTVPTNIIVLPTPPAPTAVHPWLARLRRRLQPA